MKQTLMKILKVFLVISSVILVILLVFGLVLSIGWPLWMGFFVLLGLVGLGLGVLFLRKIWLLRREQRFVQQVVDQDKAYMKGLGDKERDQAKELQDRWKEAMEAIRSSHLKKRGNPLYVLPWYLVMGESGSGKSTAIKSARLSSPFAEISKIPGISGTRNCDWWFFDQAIIIDTAGRYAIPVDEGRDKDEWQSFLNLLTKYRKREPLNGLIITIAADKLLEYGQSALEDDGRSIRQRIDELMRVMGAKFPVYILVTKCDLVQGITQFCDHLPEKSLDQAMGVINHDFSTDVASYNNRTINTIGEKLRDLRLLLFHKSEVKGIDPALLLFPEEFERLRPGLDIFVRETFQDNPYQETPLLRGLFFSSGRQEGTPYSHFLKGLGLIGERELLPGTNKGLFLHDFFAKILPKDRGLFALTQRALDWKRVTRNFALTSWLAVAVAIFGLLSFSFVKNLSTLREVSQEFSKPLVLKGEILTDIITMDRFRGATLKVEEKNRNWWVPRFGLNQSKETEVQLKDKYCKHFKDGFLASFDTQMERRMAVFSDATPDEDIAKHVINIMRRINLLRARLEGEDLETLQGKPQPFYESVAFMDNEKLIPEIREKLDDLYLYYLLWRSDSSILSKERKNLQTWLRHMVTLKGTNLNWLVTWVNGDPSLSDLTLEDFWKGSLPESDKTRITPSFTPKGKEKIDIFLKEVESALPDPLIIASRKQKFREWYHEAYITAWEDFWTVFPKGVTTLNGREEWQQAAAGMVAGKGPYFTLLERMAVELEPVTGDENLPPWIKLVYEFKRTRERAATEEALKGKGALVKASRKGGNLISRLGEKVRGVKGGGSLESQLADARSFREYEKALAEIEPVSVSRVQAYKMAVQVFSEDPADGRSPFFAAGDASDKLRASMVDDKSTRKMFNKLVTGPLYFLWTFVRKETACYLQNKWEQEVLMEVDGVADERSINRFLLGEDGYAVRFIKGAAAPFVGRSLRKKGYYAKEAFEGSIPFRGAFLSFMSKGAKVARVIKDDYDVSIKAMPTDANPGAKVRPHATRLEMECAGEIQRLINLHYPVKKTFKWSPETCEDVLFQIEVGSVILTKRYTGERAFPRFLKDFEKGKRIFYSSEFPNQKSALKRLGIRYIKVRYKFNGHKPVLKFLAVGPGKAPKEIAKCWDQ